MGGNLEKMLLVILHWCYVMNRRNKYIMDSYAIHDFEIKTIHAIEASDSFDICMRPFVCGLRYIG